MAIDPTIPFQSPQAQGGAPFNILGTIVKADTFNALQQQRADEEAARRREAIKNQVIQQHPDDPDTAIAILRRIDWQAAADLEKQVSESRKAVADRRKVELESDLNEAKLFATLLADDSESSWNAARQAAVGKDSAAARFFEQPYSPELARQARTWGLSAKERMEAEEKALASQRLEDWVEWAAKDKPEAERAAMVLLGPEKWAEIQDKAAQRALTARGQDLTAETARRGQDITAATTRRGQDLTSQTAANRLAFDKSEAAKPPTATAAKSGPNVAAIIDQIDALSQRINTEAGPMATLSGWQRNLRSKANLDNDVNEYNKLVEGMIPMVARAVGHTGVLTQQDVDSVRALFPAVTDNRTLAQNKIRRIRELLASTGTQPAPRGAAAAGGGADPLGIR